MTRALFLITASAFLLMGESCDTSGTAIGFSEPGTDPGICPTAPNSVAVSNGHGYGLTGEYVESLVKKLKNLPEETRKAMMAKFFLDRPRESHSFIAEFHPTLEKAEIQAALNAINAAITYEFQESNKVEITLATDDTEALLAAAILFLPLVRYIEANTIFSINDTEPNDLASALWGMKNFGQQVGVNGTPGADINAVKAWDSSTGSSSVIVGVIDTGINYNHVDLNDNMWTNPGEAGAKATNGVDDDKNGYIDDFRGWNFVSNNNNPMDDNGHGTHVAGTIGAEGNNAMGVVGVNWDVSLVALKFLNAAGSGNLANAVKAIEYATKMGIPITNNSWGSDGYMQSLKDAVANNSKAGYLFVAAAGNDKRDNDELPTYPANFKYPNVITVAATDNKDALSTFSNYGVGTVHLGAPGTNIYSTTSNGSWGYLSGTSMASPHVAGAAALLKARFPSATAQEIKGRLLNNAEAIASLNGRTITGGRLDVGAAMVVDNVAPGAIQNLKVDALTLSSINLSWDKAGDDGNSGNAQAYLVRVSKNAINNETDWANATEVPAVYKPTGDRVSTSIKWRKLNDLGHLVVRAQDKAGNLGLMSVSLPFTLPLAKEMLIDDFENMDKLTVSSGPWGVRAISGRSGKVLADSPNGNYSDNVDWEVRFAEMDVSKIDRAAVLKYWIKADLETRFDYFIVQVKTDVSSWQTVFETSAANCTGVEIENDIYLPADARKAQLRFVLSTDVDTVRDGVYIDDLKFFYLEGGTAPQAMEGDGRAAAGGGGGGEAASGGRCAAVHQDAVLKPFLEWLASWSLLFVLCATVGWRRLRASRVR